MCSVLRVRRGNPRERVIMFLVFTCSLKRDRGDTLLFFLVVVRPAAGGCLCKEDLVSLHPCLSCLIFVDGKKKSKEKTFGLLAVFAHGCATCFLCFANRSAVRYSLFELWLFTSLLTVRVQGLGCTYPFMHGNREHHR